MPFNSERMIHESRQMFEEMLNYVTGKEGKRATADQIERGLLQMLLKLGCQLLQLFFVSRSEQSDRKSKVVVNGKAVSYQQDKKRDYLSIFGKVAIVRPYFYKRKVGGMSPLDGELNLSERCYSDMVSELVERLGVEQAYQGVGDLLYEWLGLSLSSRVVQQTMAEDAEFVLDYYAQKAAPAAQSEATLLVIQADGKGVPMIGEAHAERPIRLGKGEKLGRKKEAIVTALYTIAPTVRTPESVVESLYAQTPAPAAHDSTASARPRPQNKHLEATLQGKQIALDRLKLQCAARQGIHIQHQVALCDGCEALQTRLQQTFPDFTLVLDFIHANEYLWQVANALYGETSPKRLVWMQQQTLSLLTGQTQELIQDFRLLALTPLTTPAQRKQLLTVSHYFERNLDYMDYPLYLARGWPIASGVIEGACRHFVKDRCELSGMRWSLAGAENLLRLRSIAENGDWKDFHSFRKQQRSLRLYLLPQATTASLEQIVLAA